MSILIFVSSLLAAVVTGMAAGNARNTAMTYVAVIIGVLAVAGEWIGFTMSRSFILISNSPNADAALTGALLFVLLCVGIFVGDQYLSKLG